MKLNEMPDEFRVWCEGCRIRIAPTEGKMMNRGKAYHERCYSKVFSVKSKPKEMKAMKAMSVK